MNNMVVDRKLLIEVTVRVEQISVKKKSWLEVGSTRSLHGCFTIPEDKIH